MTIFHSIFKNIFPWIRIKSGEGRFGSRGNYFDVDADGVATLEGTAKRGVTIRPTIDVISQVALSKPTQITRGVHKGFSMPIYNNDNEELFVGGHIADRWDGESDIIIKFLASLSGNEDVGDKFQFQLLWDCNECDGITVDTSEAVTTEITILTERNAAHNNYCLNFTIDHDAVDHVVTHDGIVGMVLRRIAASASEVNSEIIIWQFSDGIRHQIDKLYGEF